MKSMELRMTAKHHEQALCRARCRITKNRIPKSTHTRIIVLIYRRIIHPSSISKAPYSNRYIILTLLPCNVLVLAYGIPSGDLWSISSMTYLGTGMNLKRENGNTILTNPVNFQNCKSYSKVWSSVQTYIFLSSWLTSLPESKRNQTQDGSLIVKYNLCALF